MWRNGVISCCVWVLKNTHVDRKKHHPRIFNDVEYGLSFIRETLFFTCFPLPSDTKRNPVLLVKNNPHWALNHLISSVSALKKNMMFWSHFWCNKNISTGGGLILFFFRSTVIQGDLLSLVFVHRRASSMQLFFYGSNAHLMRFYAFNLTF